MINESLIPSSLVHTNHGAPATELEFLHERFITLWLGDHETEWIRGPVSVCIPLFSELKNPEYGNWQKIVVSEGEYKGYTGMFRVLEKEDLH